MKPVLAALVLTSACGSYLGIDATISVPKSVQATQTYPAVLAFSYANPGGLSPGIPSSEATFPFSGLVAAVLCQPSPSDVLVQSKLYSAPSNSDPTPVIAWIAPKPPTVTEGCGLIDPSKQQYADLPFDDTMPTASALANADGDGKPEQRTVVIDLVLAP
jgi:hypothetical protein